MPEETPGFRTAKPKQSSRLTLSDGGGLHLWVTPTGSKLWNLAYRFGGKQNARGFRLACGQPQRRSQTSRSPSLAGEGYRPERAKKDQVARNNTFDGIANKLIEKKRREGKTEKSLYKNRWARDFTSPAIGAKPIASITAADVLAVLRTVEARDHHETAVRLRALIVQVFRYGVATGRCENDPTFALRGALTTPITKHRAAIVEPVAFGGLLRAISRYAGDPTRRVPLNLLALTFVRPGELRNAQWAEFDLDGAVWSIPAGLMKMRRPHRVPLAAQAIALLPELHEITGHRRLLLPGLHSAERPISENTLNGALRRLGFLQDEMTAHGFCPAASSMLSESRKWSGHAIEHQLPMPIPTKFDARTLAPTFGRSGVEMMNWWADQLDVLQRGAELPLRA